MIDCGKDWLGRLRTVAPTAIVLTHGHPDHAAGLAKGAPCPVYATRATWALIKHFPICDRREIPARKPIMIGGITFRAWPVQHSTRAPAVGYRLSAGRSTLFYVPDVAGLPNAGNALHRIDAYIGDGATIKRSMVRRRGRTSIGHAPIVTQLAWCKNAGVRRAIFTHCGSEIVRGDVRKLDLLVQRLGREYGVEARIARDGECLSFSD
jgi:phosphoribosyl 1,2-cyclic phosphodiesterase